MSRAKGRGKGGGSRGARGRDEVLARDGGWGLSWGWGTGSGWG